MSNALKYVHKMLKFNIESSNRMNNHNKQSRKSRGFTLVELLIVIAVIAILAAIAIVSYASTRNSALKNSYESTAQQVKLKLGEYFTDNNHYPRYKSNVITYLNDINAGSSVVDEFNKSAYTYHSYTNSSMSSSCTGANCQYFEIRVNKSNWNGGSSDSNLVVKP